MKQSSRQLAVMWRSAAYPGVLVNAAGTVWVLAMFPAEFGVSWAGFVGALGWVPVLTTGPVLVAAIAGVGVSLVLSPALRTAAPGVAATAAGVASAAVAGLLAWWILGSAWHPATHAVLIAATLVGVVLAWFGRSARPSQPPRCEAALARAVVVSLAVTLTLVVLAAVVGVLFGPAWEMTRLQGFWMAPWLVASLSFPLVALGVWTGLMLRGYFRAPAAKML